MDLRNGAAKFTGQDNLALGQLKKHACEIFITRHSSPNLNANIPTEWLAWEAKYQSHLENDFEETYALFCKRTRRWMEDINPSGLRDSHLQSSIEMTFEETVFRLIRECGFDIVESKTKSLEELPVHLEMVFLQFRNQISCWPVREALLRLQFLQAKLSHCNHDWEEAIRSWDMVLAHFDFPIHKAPSRNPFLYEYYVAQFSRTIARLNLEPQQKTELIQFRKYERELQRLHPDADEALDHTGWFNAMKESMNGQQEMPPLPKFRKFIESIRSTSTIRRTLSRSPQRQATDSTVRSKKVSTESLIVPKLVYAFELT